MILIKEVIMRLFDQTFELGYVCSNIISENEKLGSDKEETI